MEAHAWRRSVRQITVRINKKALIAAQEVVGLLSSMERAARQNVVNANVLQTVRGIIPIKARQTLVIRVATVITPLAPVRAVWAKLCLRMPSVHQTAWVVDNLQFVLNGNVTQAMLREAKVV